MTQRLKEEEEFAFRIGRGPFQVSGVPSEKEPSVEMVLQRLAGENEEP